MASQSKNTEIKSITYSLSAPYSGASLVFTPDGNVTYEAESHEVADAHKESDQGKISKEQFQSLAKLIQESGFMDLKDAYKNEFLEDGSTQSISVELGAGGKSVSCYGSCPEVFGKIVKKIEELWSKPIMHVGM